jgi:hypothetical protein
VYSTVVMIISVIMGRVHGRTLDVLRYKKPRLAGLDLIMFTLASNKSL